MAENDLIITILISVLVVVLIFAIRGFMSHRIYVEILEKVANGYISKGGRYKLIRDKNSKMYFLQPMGKGQRIPAFASECFIKVNGAPYIGLLRYIMLIKVNPYSYKVILPPFNNSSLGEVRNDDIKNWVFVERKRLFKKKWNAEKVFYMLGNIAYGAVIIGMPLFLMFAVYMEIYTTQQFLDDAKVLLSQIAQRFLK